MNIESERSSTRIKIGKPYKILAIKEKLYRDHYGIPASECLVVPQKRLGDDLLCCVYWRRDSSRHILQNLMFTSENLEPVDSIAHEGLFELWESINR